MWHSYCFVLLWDQILMSLTNDPLHFLTPCYINALCVGIDVKTVTVFCTEENHLLGCGSK